MREADMLYERAPQWPAQVHPRPAQNCRRSSGVRMRHTHLPERRLHNMPAGDFANELDQLAEEAPAK